MTDVTAAPKQPSTLFGRVKKIGTRLKQNIKPMTFETWKSKQSDDIINQFETTTLLQLKKGFQSKSKICCNWLVEQNPEKLSQFKNTTLAHVITGLESENKQCREWCLSQNIDGLSGFEQQLHTVKNAFESSSPLCRDWFAKQTADSLNKFSQNELGLICKTLESDVPECRDWFAKHTAKELRDLGSTNILNRVQEGLSSQNPECVNFFAQNTPEILEAFPDGDALSIRLAFEGHRPDILDDLNAEKEAAETEYMSLKPADISEEQMRDNIEGLYAPMIHQVIQYSKRATDELGLSRKEAYSQRTDKKKFQDRRSVILGSAVFSGADIKGLTADALRTVGEFVGGDPRDLMVTKQAAEAAKEVFTRLKPPTHI